MQIDCDFVLAALNTVLDWDIPDAVCSDAVTAQAGLMAGLEAEQFWVGAADTTVH